MECLASNSRSIRVNGGPPAQHTWSSILLHSTYWALSEMDIILVFETSDAWFNSSRAHQVIFKNPLTIVD